MKEIFKHFCKDDSGATAIEYALIAAIVGIGIIVALQSMTQGLNATFNQTTTDLAAAVAE